MKLAEKDVLVNWHPYTQMKTAKPPVTINRAQGVYLYDEEDNTTKTETEAHASAIQSFP